MNRFEQIQNDRAIIEIYNQIGEFEDLDKGWAHHNLEHVKNVAQLVEDLLSKLNYDKDFIEEAKIAAILHDVGAIEGKEGHAVRSYNFAKRYFLEKDIPLENEEMVLEAIKVHSEGFECDNIIAIALILSDKLDIKYTRVAKEGYNAKGMRQLQYIREIEVDIRNQNLIVQFWCKDEINKRELEEFYFMIKVFKAIIAFSNKMSLGSIVLFNNEEWQAFNNLRRENY